MTVTMIPAPEEGRNGRGMREVEDISGYAPADGLLADMLSTDGPAEREALAKEAVTVIGRAIADGLPVDPRDCIVVAATRTRAPWRASVAAELYDLQAEAMRERQAECAAEALAGAVKEIDKALSKGRDASAMRRIVGNVLVRLGFDSHVDLATATPHLVAQAGLDLGEVARFVEKAGVVRENREARAQNAYRERWEDRTARRRERRQSGLSCFETYPIRLTTISAATDADFEVAEIAQAEVEIVEAATQTGAGLIAEAKSKGADLGTILVEVFTAACKTRGCSLDVDVMIAALADAAGDNKLASIFERTIAAARACASPAETEAAFSRLLAAEGVAAPFSFAPADEIESHPSAVDERSVVAAALAEIGSSRNRPAADLTKIARRVGRATTAISAEKLAERLIAKSGEVTTYMHDAIRLSVSEARQAGPAFDDRVVEARVDRMLKAVHAPITGEPGLAERNAEVVAKAMSPNGATGPTPFVWRDPHCLPRRAWLCGTSLIRQELTATIAPGGVGKTALTIVEALALASGRPLLGVMPARRCKVWIWSGEEPRAEMEKRILAACEYHGLSAADIEGMLFVDNFESFDLILAEQTRDGTTIFQPKVDLLIRWIAKNEIDVVFIDPAISTHNVGENDNVAIQKWATAWKSVAVGANAAISIAHHAKKLGGQVATADDSRGARSFVDKCRIVRSLNPMTKDEAERFKIPVEDRRYFFSIDPTEAKANMAPAVGGKQWFKSNSVVLGAKRNGPLDLGESIGVVGSWRPPAPTDKLDEGKIEALREAVGGRRWRAAALTFGRPDSIGAPIAEAFDLDLDSPADKQRARTIYAALLKQDVLVEERVQDENYKQRPYARLADQ